MGEKVRKNNRKQQINKDHILKCTTGPPKGKYKS